MNARGVVQVFRVQGRVVEVEAGRTVRGAFGDEPALLLKVERSPGADRTDYVYVPDCAENRKIAPGFVFDAPVMVEVVQYAKGAFLSVRSAFVLKG